jgi:hypothetical protein
MSIMVRTWKYSCSAGEVAAHQIARQGRFDWARTGNFARGLWRPGAVSCRCALRLGPVVALQTRRWRGLAAAFVGTESTDETFELGLEDGIGSNGKTAKLLKSAHASLPISQAGKPTSPPCAPRTRCASTLNSGATKTQAVIAVRRAVAVATRSAHVPRPRRSRTHHG